MYEELAALFNKEIIDSKELGSLIEDLESEIEDLESEIEDLESEIEDLECSICDNKFDLSRLMDELMDQIKDLDDKKQTLTVDPIAKLWLASAKSFYEDAGCYHGSSLVSEYYITDYFMDTVYEILDECPKCVQEFVDRKAFAEYMSNDLTVVEIKYPSQDGVATSESWYVV